MLVNRNWVEPGLNVGYSTRVEPTFGWPYEKGVSSLTFLLAIYSRRDTLLNSTDYSCGRPIVLKLFLYQSCYFGIILTKLVTYYSQNYAGTFRRRPKNKRVLYFFTVIVHSNMKVHKFAACSKNVDNLIVFKNMNYHRARGGKI